MEPRDRVLGFAEQMEAELQRIERCRYWEGRDRWWLQCRLHQLESGIHFAVIEHRPVAPVALEMALVAMRIADLEELQPARAAAKPAQGGPRWNPLRWILDRFASPIGNNPTSAPS